MAKAVRGFYVVQYPISIQSEKAELRGLPI